LDTKSTGAIQGGGHQQAKVLEIDQSRNLSEPTASGEKSAGDGRRRLTMLDSSPKAGAAAETAREILEPSRTEIPARKLFDEEFSKVFHINPACMAISTVEDGRFIDVNDSFLATLGYAREEVIGRTSKELSLFVDWSRREEAVRRLHTGERVRQFEATIRCRNGDVLYGSFAAAKMEVDGVPRLLTVMIDTTERRRVEESLRTQARMLDAVQQTVVAVDKNGIITYWNEFAERLYGWRRDDVIGRSPDGFLDIIDLDSVRPEIEACVRQNRSWTGEVTVVNRAGQHVPMLTMISPVFDGGEYAGFISVALDITDRKQAEQALRQSEERYGSIFKDSAIPLWELDASRVKAFLERVQRGRNGDVRAHFDIHPEAVRECVSLLELTDANAESLRLFQARDFRELAERFPTMVVDESLPVFANWLTLVAEGTTRMEGEIPLVTLAGEPRHVAIRLSVAPGSRESLDRVLVSMVDITERRRAEEALRRRAAFDELLTRLLARFACAAASEIDDLIRRCLEEVGIVLGGDNAFVILVAHDFSTWSSVYSWRPGGETSYNQKYQNIPIGTLPWCERMVLTGNIVRIATLEELPSEAEAERRAFAQEGVRSFVAVPLRGRGGHIHGCVGLRSHARRIDWTEEDVGRLSMVADTIANVLERKRAEEAHRLSEEKYAKAFESSPDAIVLSELSTSIFLEVNAGFERISGYTRDEVVGRSALDLGVWGNPVERAEIAARLQKDGHVRDFEVSMRSKTKVPLMCLLSAEIIEYGGQPRMLAILRDIREQKKTVEALRLSEEKYAKAFDSSPDAVIISRVADGRLMEVNAGFEGITGYTRREAIGCTASELGLWADFEDRSRVVARLRDGQCVRNMEARFVSKTGLIRDCLVSAEVLEINGQPCMLPTIRDISELKQAQVELAQAKALLSAAIDQSTAGILIARASDCRILIANRAAMNIRGGDMAELTEVPLEERPGYWRIYKPDGTMFRPEELPLVQAILTRRTTRNAEAVIKRVDGVDRWILINAAPIIDPAGNIVAGVAVFADVTDIKRVEMMLERLVQGTSAGADRQFFDSLVRGLALGVGCRYAYCAEFAGSTDARLKAQAFWNGKKSDRNFEFAAAGIAGEILTERKTVVCLKGLAEAYPDDAHAARLGAESFIGMPVFGADGKPLGLLAVLDDKPIPGEIVPQVQSVMTIAAARAAAEIERQRAYEELQVANARLLDEHKALMEKNIALQTILDHLERERMEYRRDICTSIDHVLTPAIKKLRGREGMAGNRDLAALEDALDSIIGGGIDTFENNYNKLTPREAEICTSIAQGRTSKEIADSLHLSVQTVHKHREAIRRKLQVQNLDINLSTYLPHRVR